MAVNKRLVYFLIFLVVVLPVITGILVWQLLPTCDDADDNLAGSMSGKDKAQTTKFPGSETKPTETPFEDGPWKTLRLPRDITPQHYDVTLYPDFYGNNAWFYGNVTMQLRVNKETQFIMVHINYLNVTKASLYSSTPGEYIGIKRRFEYKPNQFLVVEAETALQENTTVHLNIEFDGSLSRSIVGLYKSTYINSLTQESRSITTSKFEPVAARRAFPCMDEPNMKAEFSVKLVHNSSYTALSNMPVKEIVTWPGDPDLKITKFERSVKMSTYLVCFIVCDFTYLEHESKHNVTVRLYAPSDRINQTRYALEVAVTTVDLYTKMFNISYPLPKLDLIAIPDFVSGAMEHWGLITFRETNLLYSDDQSSSANKQRVATVIAHEVSHQVIYGVSSFTGRGRPQPESKVESPSSVLQWFGNLVTMDWWQDLWLNEGFASFMEYLGAAEHEPKWDLPGQFLKDDLQPVMVTDADLSSHPIVVNVQDPSQINAVFDSISYSKGSSVIRMLENWMGKDRFFHGISKYLKAYQYQNARTDDLWEKLGTISQGLSVKTVMDTWTKQMGLPFINITVDETGHVITAEQFRFLADSTFKFNASKSAYNYRWYIKLDYITSKNEKGNHWLKMTPLVTFNISTNLKSDTASWIKFNAEETGFYRVNYPQFLWERFSTELSKGGQMTINVADRANLIDDAFNLARASVVEYNTAMEMTMYLNNELDYIPWYSATRGYSYISNMLETTGDYGILQQYWLSKVSPVLDKIGMTDNGTHLERRLRSLLFSQACHYGHKKSLDTVAVMFQQWLHNGTQIPPNYRSTVYKYGMMYSGSTDDWDTMWRRYLAEPVAQEKVKLMSALAQTRTVWLLTRYIEYAKDESNVRSQDYFNVLIYIARNPVGKDLVWRWIRNNWTYLVDRFTLYSRYFGRLVPSVVSGFNTKNQLEEVQSFFSVYPEAGAGANGRKQALENINRNINWMTTNKNTIVNWLQQHTNK